MLAFAAASSFGIGMKIPLFAETFRLRYFTSVEISHGYGRTHCNKNRLVSPHNVAIREGLLRVRIFSSIVRTKIVRFLNRTKRTINSTAEFFKAHHASMPKWVAGLPDNQSREKSVVWIRYHDYPLYG